MSGYVSINVSPDSELVLVGNTYGSSEEVVGINNEGRLVIFDENFEANITGSGEVVYLY